MLFSFGFSLINCILGPMINKIILERLQKESIADSNPCFKLNFNEQNSENIGEYFKAALNLSLVGAKFSFSLRDNSKLGAQDQFGADFSKTEELVLGSLLLLEKLGMNYLMKVNFRELVSFLNTPDTPAPNYYLAEKNDWITVYGHIVSEIYNQLLLQNLGVKFLTLATCYESRVLDLKELFTKINSLNEAFGLPSVDFVALEEDIMYLTLSTPAPSTVVAGLGGSQGDYISQVAHGEFYQKFLESVLHYVRFTFNSDSLKLVAQ